MSRYCSFGYNTVNVAQAEGYLNKISITWYSTRFTTISSGINLLRKNKLHGSNPGRTNFFSARNINTFILKVLIQNFVLLQLVCFHKLYRSSDSDFNVPKSLVFPFLEEFQVTLQQLYAPTYRFRRRASEEFFSNPME